MIDAQLALPDGRTVGYTDWGHAAQTAVFWCHGGPGSRFEAGPIAAAASEIGLRTIGIDRPGYGKSTPRPGRDIASWVPDALAVADRLGIERFASVGVSTGGAYSLALAALAPERVLGVVPCCALTDMRWAEGKAMMSGAGTADIWKATSRDAAIALATEIFGADGSKMMSSATSGPPLPAADLAIFANPTFMSGWAASFPAMFAHGVQGYADDRLADGPGWGSFDASRVTCPVTVLHGAEDTIVPVAHAHHSAALVPGAKLRVCEGLGHFSIITEVVPAVAALVR
jgi:pimeloyl-ACP methyl ester carboxylesterase